MTDPSIVPDTKDWTWVLTRPCEECGFDPAAVDRAALAAMIADLGPQWRAALADADDPTTRPRPDVWSPLEYACHVRDVLALATYRTGLMRTEVDPLFANWDQDATAVEDGYAAQDVDEVLAALAQRAAEYAQAVAAVPEDEWTRTGRRSDGAVFTIESFTRYLLHDPIHHLVDVTGTRFS